MSINLKKQDIGKPGPGIHTGAEELGLAGEAVREAEIDYRAIFEAMGHATALIENDLTITLTNSEFEKLSGYSRKEIDGKKTLAAFLAPHDAREIKDYFSQRGEDYNAPPKNYKILLTNKQGEPIEAVVTLTMVPQLRKSVLTLADVRKLREAEESLKSSEARFRSLFENSPVGITLSRGDSLIYANPAFLRMFGLDETTKLQGKTFMNFVAPISRQMITERPERRMQGQDMSGSLAEAIGQRKDGTTFPVQIEVFSIDLFDGPASVTFISDITERKQAEEALKRESGINEALAELSSALILSKSIDEVSDLVLDSAKRLTGSAIGYVGYIEPETGRLICPTLIREIGEMCQVPDKNIVFKEFSGLWGWVLNNRKPLIINSPAEDPRSTGTPLGHLPIRRFLSAPAIYNGMLTGQIALANSDREYTEQDLKLMERLAELYAIAINRKRSEDELALRAQLLDSANDSIVLYDFEGRLHYVNEVACKFYGYTSEELMQKKVFDLTVLESAENHQFRLNELKTKGRAMFEAVDSRKDGTHIPVEVNAKVLEVEGRQLVLSVARDITERKRAEERLRESFAKLAKTFEQTVESLSSMAEIRDPYTAGHQVRVAKLACEIASELGMSEEQVNAIRTAALIHDIGKIIVPSELLNKPGVLNALERSFVEAHAQAGYEILNKIEFELPIAEIVLQHHEKLDGSGYPRGLSGDSILKEASVLTVADIVEAMASHRPYRPALPLKTALEEISRHKGALYDADVVDACLRLFLEKGFSLS